MTADPSLDIAAFEAERPRLRALAYRMLGMCDEADDVVQDAWLRYAASPQEVITPAAWLTTTVTRLAIDRLRSARIQRETYVGPWLPEAIGGDDLCEGDPERALLLAESVSLGFMALLERLSPLERAVFLLSEVFDVPLREVAEIVDRAPATVRQLAKRARDHVRAGRPRFAPDPHDVEALSDAFLAAAINGDLATLESMLTRDVVHVSDGGARYRAARRPVVGRARVARFILNLAKRVPPHCEIYKVHANGQFANYAVVDGEPYMLLVANWVDHQLAGSFGIRNPDKLAAFHRAFEANRQATR